MVSAAPRPDDIAKALCLPAFSADSLPPDLHGALTRLIAERDRLREDLAKARHRIHGLERLADEDALTPVANRRAFVRQLTRMIAFSNRYGVPASIVYFDVNNMKQINDKHGHAAGDAALRHLAMVLRDNIRASDVVGRLGGDEFGVILAQTDEAQAHDKAAALAAAVDRAPLQWGELTIPVTAAYGIHAFSGGENPQRAIEEADRAMYEQKRAMHAHGHAPGSALGHAPERAAS
ncbi:MAG: GGDEF domain-containing protein [Alphaproteobacteria bacterium]|nr:GGDEF domain-containing protein [Alphaproteobacteria bacterium]